MYKGQTGIKGQVNVRLDADEYIKIKALSGAENRSMSKYATMIVKNYLKAKKLPRQWKKWIKGD